MSHDSRSDAVQAIVHGSVTGILAGYVVKTVSGALAFIAGTSIILYEVGINVKWTENESDEFTSALLDFSRYLSLLPGTRLICYGMEYARGNKCYFTSFIGGFLIGFGLPDIAKQSPLAMSFNAQLVLDCRELLGRV